MLKAAAHLLEADTTMRSRNMGSVLIFEDPPSPTPVTAYAAIPEAQKEKNAADMRDSLLVAPQTRKSTRRQTRDEISGALGRTGEGLEDLEASGTRKYPRRRTTYVPSDDTTPLKIHSGMNPTNMTTHSLAGPEGHRPKQTRKPLTAPPRRAPLLPSMKPIQETETPIDRLGDATGKENVPPGKMMPFRPSKRISTKGAEANDQTATSMVEFTPPAGRKAQRTIPCCLSERHASGTARKPHMASHRPILLHQADSQSSPPIPLAREDERKASSQMLPSPLKYPILREDLARPGTIENASLEKQEAIIKAILNSPLTFEAMALSNAPKELCGSLAKMYQDATMPLLHIKLEIME